MVAARKQTVPGPAEDGVFSEAKSISVKYSKNYTKGKFSDDGAMSHNSTLAADGGRELSFLDFITDGAPPLSLTEGGLNTDISPTRMDAKQKRRNLFNHFDISADGALPFVGKPLGKMQEVLRPISPFLCPSSVLSGKRESELMKFDTLVPNMFLQCHFSIETEESLIASLLWPHPRTQDAAGLTCVHCCFFHFQLQRGRALFSNQRSLPIFQMSSPSRPASKWSENSPWSERPSALVYEEHEEGTEV